MSEILFRNFQLLVSVVCWGLLHQLSVTEISDPFCHSVAYRSQNYADIWHSPSLAFMLYNRYALEDGFQDIEELGD
jgi:hypothetical protein